MSVASEGASSEADSPLSFSAIKQLLRIDQQGRLVRRESSTLELKQSFNWAARAEYTRTIAAFANAQGGYMVFGVGDSPREIVGLKTKRFDELDDAKITAFLNEHLAPEVRIERCTYEIDGHEVGVIWTPRSKRPPVVCTRDAGDALRDGDIYYRYRARSQRIRHSELRAILEDEAKRQHDKLLNMVLKVAKVGVGNVVILNTADGELFMPDTGRAVLIDEELLSKVNFIKEGSFNEIDGDPTLRVIGDAMPSQVVTHEKAVALHATEMIAAFLGDPLPSGATALSVLDQMPYEATSFLPIYCFARQAGLTNEEAAARVKSSKASSSTKARLVKALQEGRGGACCAVGSLKSGASSESDARFVFVQELIAGRLIPDSITDHDLKLVLQALTHLSPSQLRDVEEHITAVLRALYPRTRDDGTLRLLYGYALCHADCMLHASPLPCCACGGLAG